MNTGPPLITHPTDGPRPWFRWAITLAQDPPDGGDWAQNTWVLYLIAWLLLIGTHI
jgi:hypothetical protein